MEMEIHFKDKSGNIYSAYFGITKYGDEWLKLWNMRANDCGLTSVPVANDDNETYSTVEFFTTKEDLLNWTKANNLEIIE